MKTKSFITSALPLFLDLVPHSTLAAKRVERYCIYLVIFCQSIICPSEHLCVHPAKVIRHTRIMCNIMISDSQSAATQSECMSVHSQVKGPRYMLNFHGYSRHLTEILHKFHAFYQPHNVLSHQSPPMPIIFAMPNAVTCSSPTVMIIDHGKVRITNVDYQQQL